VGQERVRCHRQVLAVSVDGQLHSGHLQCGVRRRDSDDSFEGSADAVGEPGDGHAGLTGAGH